MKDITISDLADLSQEHKTAREGIERAILRLEEILMDTSGWRKRDGPTVEHYRLRRDLPYCVHKTSLDGVQILVNRNYKPLGSNADTGGKFAKYEEYPNSHLKLTLEQVENIAVPKENSYLFGDSTAPWRGKGEARAYLKRLHHLLKHL